MNEKTADELPPYLLKSHVIPAIKGFFRSISLSARSSLQDTLRILRLMFRYGSNAEVNATLSEGFGTVNIDTWLEVIPQVQFSETFADSSLLPEFIPRMLALEEQSSSYWPMLERPIHKL